MRKSKFVKTISRRCVALAAIRLQILRVRLFSNTGERLVRVLLDSRSECSYIRTDVAKELGYEHIGKQDFVHSLFGEHQSRGETLEIFRVRIRV